MNQKLINFVTFLLIIASLMIFMGCTETEDTNISDSPAVTETPTTTPKPTNTPSTTIEEAKQYIVDELERDPDIIDAGVAIEGTQGSIAVYIVNPQEADRVYTLSKTMANVFLKEHNVKSVIIGVYKGDDQLKYGAEWL